MDTTTLERIFGPEPRLVLTRCGRVYATPDGVSPEEKLAFLAGIETVLDERGRRARLGEALAQLVRRVGRSERLLQHAITVSILTIAAICITGSFLVVAACLRTLP